MSFDHHLHHKKIGKGEPATDGLLCTNCSRKWTDNQHSHFPHCSPAITLLNEQANVLSGTCRNVKERVSMKKNTRCNCNWLKSASAYALAIGIAITWVIQWKLDNLMEELKLPALFDIFVGNIHKWGRKWSIVSFSTSTPTISTKVVMQMDFGLHRLGKHGRYIKHTPTYSGFGFSRAFCTFSSCLHNWRLSHLSLTKCIVKQHFPPPLSMFLKIFKSNVFNHIYEIIFVLFHISLCFEFIFSVECYRNVREIEICEHHSSSSKTNSRNKHLNQRCLEKSPILIRSKYLLL